MSTVYAIVPVFNRLEMTQRLVDDLRAQRGCEMRIVVIDDGSTDGTAQWLATQPDVLTIHGDGNLWWAGAVDAALRRVLPRAGDDDYVLLINNDTRIAADFVITLVGVSRVHARSVVGTVLREQTPPHELISIGARMSVWHRRVSDVLAELPLEERRDPKPVYEVDALSGRGTLYPVGVLRATGYLHPHLLPHYHADYELACRARRKGFRTLVSTAAALYTEKSFGVHRAQSSRWQRLFGKGSPANIFQGICFWLLVGTPLQRATAIPCMLIDLIKRAVYRLLPQPVRYLAHGCRLVLRAPFSGEARARLFRRLLTARRSGSEAWHAYTAGTLIDIYGRDVLVVGCGDGRICGHFVRLGARTVHGLDSDDGLGSAYAQRRVRYVRGQANALPVRSGVYALVFCVAAAESRPSSEALLEEMARVTSDGGLIYRMSDAKAYSREELVAAAQGLVPAKRTVTASACVS